MKKLLALLISPFLFLHNTGLAEDNSSPEKALLSSAIKIYSSISPDEDVKSRISKSALTILAPIKPAPPVTITSEVKR